MHGAGRPSGYFTHDDNCLDFVLVCTLYVAFAFEYSGSSTLSDLSDLVICLRLLRLLWAVPALREINKAVFKSITALGGIGMRGWGWGWG